MAQRDNDDDLQHCKRHYCRHSNLQISGTGLEIKEPEPYEKHLIFTSLFVIKLFNFWWLFPCFSSPDGEYLVGPSWLWWSRHSRRLKISCQTIVWAGLLLLFGLPRLKSLVLARLVSRRLDSSRQQRRVLATILQSSHGLTFSPTFLYPGQGERGVSLNSIRPKSDYPFFPNSGKLDNNLQFEFI